MKIRPLMIGPREEAMIAEAMRRARANPTPMRTLVASDHHDVIKDTHALPLDKRRPGTEKQVTHGVVIPFGYHAAVSYEEQPDGLAIHVSVSVEERGKMPGEAAVKAILARFGVPWKGWHSAWVEEFQPGHNALNVVMIVEFCARSRA